MIRKSLIYIPGLVMVGLLLAACGGPSPDASETDRVATRVAEELAVTMTLTAVAPPPTEVPTAVPVEPTATAAVPTDTAVPPTAVSTEAPQATPVPTNTPVPTETPVSAPTDTPPPEPTATPILIAILPVDGSDGNQNLHNDHAVKDGRNILLPGFSQAQVSEPMVFRDRAVFRVEVFDDAAGSRDGDGIQNVTFTISDESGNPVHERTENQAGYCVFGGGEPDCDVWVFAEHDYRWPGGAPIVNGTYSVEAVINPENGEGVSWFWSFVVELPG
jgi:hypothetical protein